MAPSLSSELPIPKLFSPVRTLSDVNGAGLSGSDSVTPVQIVLPIAHDVWGGIFVFSVPLDTITTFPVKIAVSPDPSRGKWSW